MALKLRRAEERFIPQSTRAVSFKRLLGGSMTTASNPTEHDGIKRRDVPPIAIAHRHRNGIDMQNNFERPSDGPHGRRIQLSGDREPQEASRPSVASDYHRREFQWHRVISSNRYYGWLLAPQNDFRLPGWKLDVQLTNRVCHRTMTGHPCLSR